MRKKFPGIYTRPNPQRQVLEQPIRAKILSNEPIKWNLKTIMNGLPRFSRAFHRLHDFHFEFWLVNHNTLASVIDSDFSHWFYFRAVCLSLKSPLHQDKSNAQYLPQTIQPSSTKRKSTEVLVDDV